MNARGADADLCAIERHWRLADRAARLGLLAIAASDQSARLWLVRARKEPIFIFADGSTAKITVGHLTGDILEKSQVLLLQSEISDAPFTIPRIDV